MDKQDIQLINEILKSKVWLRLTQNISEQDDNTIHYGALEIDTAKGILHFEIRISADFPLKKIEFICTSHRGYPHIMRSGLMCLNTAPSATIRDRLELELEKLNLWVDKYFIKEEVDEHFEFYEFSYNNNIHFIFEEDENKESIIGNYGRFDYGILNKLNIGEKKCRTLIALNLGGRKCRWSKSFLRNITNKFSGLWVLLKDHPVLERRFSIEDWNDLLGLLDHNQTRFLYDEYRKIIKQSDSEDQCILMAGYEISNNATEELHWDAIVIPFNDFPFGAQKLHQGVYGPNDLGKKVQWCRTTNASYKRLFGRGKLSDFLTDKNILVIGTGAIGSSLFISLVRGGCKKIEISDFDDIDPGNICRGHFSFNESWKPKIYELYTSSISISPYLDLQINSGIFPIAKSNNNYSALKDKLGKFDLIFDCTTDKYLSIMLDEMELPGQIINLSITNHANHFVAITGKGNIHKIKNETFNKIAPNRIEPFYVATGCWHPTFQASYSDINILLMYALNEINFRLEEQRPVNSFIITKQFSDAKSLQFEISYNV